MTEPLVAYRPDRVTPPGASIADILEERGMTQRDLALRMGRPYKTINEIVRGKASITPATALQLETVLSVPTAYWLRHEALYQAQQAREEQQATYAGWTEWLDHLPLRELKRLGILPDVQNRGHHRADLVRAALAFFGVTSPDQWQEVYSGRTVRFRCTQVEASDPYATATWLRLGELQAQGTVTAPHSAARLRAVLPALRALTRRAPEEFEPLLRRQLADVGVILALVPAIRAARVSGAARWIGNRPLVQLSLLGKCNDRFWFTLFHEIGHILEHDPRLIFLDDWHYDKVSQLEQEADRFAANLLIPPQYQPELQGLRSEASVRAFADRLSLHPGVVVGRLQHEGVIPYAHLNGLKDRFAWRESNAS